MLPLLALWKALHAHRHTVQTLPHFGTTLNMDLTRSTMMLLHFYDRAWIPFAIKTSFGEMLLPHVLSDSQCFFFFFGNCLSPVLQKSTSSSINDACLGPMPVKADRYSQCPIKLGKLTQITVSMFKILATFNLQSFLMHGNILFFPTDRHGCKCSFQAIESVLTLSPGHLPHGSLSTSGD